jgi:hypothetical protein
MSHGSNTLTGKYLAIVLVAPWNFSFVSSPSHYSEREGEASRDVGVAWWRSFPGPGTDCGGIAPILRVFS